MFDLMRARGWERMCRERTAHPYNVALKGQGDDQGRALHNHGGNSLGGISRKVACPTPDRCRIEWEKKGSEVPHGMDRRREGAWTQQI